jgi:hypothetical protein
MAFDFISSTAFIISAIAIFSLSDTLLSIAFRFSPQPFHAAVTG